MASYDIYDKLKKRYLQKDIIAQSPSDALLLVNGTTENPDHRFAVYQNYITD